MEVGDCGKGRRCAPTVIELLLLTVLEFILLTIIDFLL
jgi:hypothetical protein